jgi:Putative Actinobacterial Holin-X, holin superfamily III
MSDRITTESSPSMASLLGGIVSDIQTLVRQEIALAKTEMLREWDKAKTAAGSLAVGAAFLVLGGILLCVSVVCVLHEVAGLPWWASFLIVGGVLAGIGAGLFFIGRNQAADVNVIPPQTAATMKENVEWMSNKT